MRVFISWSGPTSKLVAEALRTWPHSVIQSVDPFMSADTKCRAGMDLKRGLRRSFAERCA